MTEFTFILAGKVGVGKTSIFKRIQTGEFMEQSLSNAPSKSDSEMEHQVYNVTLNDTQYKVSIWDTGGLERYHSMTSSYFRYCNAVILVYDSSPDNIGSLLKLREWIDDARINSVFGERVVFSLWANKCEEVSSDVATSQVVTAFMEEYKIPESLHFKVSAKTGENCIESLHTLISTVHNTAQSTAPSNIASTSTEIVVTPHASHKFSWCKC